MSFQDRFVPIIPQVNGIDKHNADGMSKNERDLWITEAYTPGIHRPEEQEP